MKNLRKPSSILPLMLASMAIMPGKGQADKIRINTHKIELKKEEGQLSKQNLQKMKGKGARKNRGKNRRNK